VKQDELLLVFERAHGNLEHEILKGELSLGQKFSIAKEIAQGMNFLQDNSIIHLDLNPKNVLMTSDFHVKLSDFDFSITLKEDLVFTFYGTPIYTAPEVLIRKKPEMSTDIYSFGMILFFIFSGHNPLENISIPTIDDLVTFLAKLDKKGDTVGDSLLLDLVPSPRIREMIKKCCKTITEERYQRFDQINTVNIEGIDSFTEIYTAERFDENKQLQQASKTIWTSHNDQMPFETFMSNFYNYYKVDVSNDEWKNELMRKVFHVENVQKTEIAMINLKYLWRFYNLFGEYLKPGSDPFKKLRDLIFGMDWYFGDIEDNYSSQLLTMYIQEKKKTITIFLLGKESEI